MVGRRIEKGVNGSAFPFKDVIKLRLQSRQLLTIATFDRAFVGRLIEIDRRLLELIKHKHKRTQQQNEKLHRHLHRGVEEQSQTTLLQGTSCEVTLHLRLIRTEIGKREKEAANQARPESVAFVGVKRKIDRLQFAHLAGHGQSMTEWQLGR